jgi:uncharacterized protein YjbI with pentapeptide repeats
MSGRIDFNRILTLLAGLLVLMGAVALGSYGVHLNNLDFRGIVDAFYVNASTGLVAIMLIVLFVDGLNRRRARADEKRREELAVEQEKQRLILQMGSPNNAFAGEAARLLRIRGWGYAKESTLHGVNLVKANLQETNLEGISLQRADLWYANLSGAILNQANLRGANLGDASLRGAALSYADLCGARLKGADLKDANLGWARFDEATILPDGFHWTPGTDLRCFTDPSFHNFWRGYGLENKDWRNRDFRQANLKGANLTLANLRGADMWGVDLYGADLRKAILKGARLTQANLREASLEGIEADETTVLPDGSRWTSTTDLTRFTDPDHLDFWRSDETWSPAFHGY